MVNYKTGTFNNKITWNHVRYLGLRLTQNTAKKEMTRMDAHGCIEEADLCDLISFVDLACYCRARNSW